MEWDKSDINKPNSFTFFNLQFLRSYLKNVLLSKNNEVSVGSANLQLIS